MSFTWKIRILLWSALTIGLFFILYRAIVPFGAITYTQDFEDDDYFIAKLTPADRVTVADGRAAITGDPVYFSLRTPRRFDRATVKVRFRNESKLPVVELGALVDKAAWRWDLQPLGNAIIDSLALVWPVVKDGPTILLQRNADYASVAEFYTAEPLQSTVATYNYQLALPYRLEGYEPADKAASVLPRSVKGSYRYHVYIKDETLEQSIVFTDLNLNRDPDPVNLAVSVNGQVIHTQNLDDDGIATDSKVPTAGRTIALSLPNLPEGAYLVELKGNSDILTTDIQSKQAKMAFVGGLEFERTATSALSLITDSRRIQIVTVYPERLQTVTASGDRYVIDETYRQFEFDLTDATSTLRFERDGIKVSGDGTFAFSPEAFFDPRPKRVDRNLDPGSGELRYIIAGYEIPVTTGGWQAATAEFDLSNAYRENGAYSFVLSIPGLRADDTASDSVVIDRITVTLGGKTLFQKIKELFNSW